MYSIILVPVCIKENICSLPIFQFDISYEHRTSLSLALDHSDMKIYKKYVLIVAHFEFKGIRTNLNVFKGIYLNMIYT